MERKIKQPTEHKTFFWSTKRTVKKCFLKNGTDRRANKRITHSSSKRLYSPRTEERKKKRERYVISKQTIGQF